MLSKRLCRARIALACACVLTVTGCRSAMTRAVERQDDHTEVNASFVIEDNLLRLNTVTVDGRAGRFLLGSAHPRTLVSPAFAGSGAPRHMAIQLNDRHALDVEPLMTDLGGVGEAVIGFDAWRGHAITINYVSGLVTYQDSGMIGGELTVYRFQDQPAIGVMVNGTPVVAVVDTASPDTLVLPRGDAPAGRAKARVEIAGVIFPDVDIALADTSRARVGNRLLSKFLVSIDYARLQVGLWRDPRVPLE